MTDKLRQAAQTVVDAYDNAYHVSVPLSDAIDALRAALAEPSWIPVTARLPENKRVLAWNCQDIWDVWHSGDSWFETSTDKKVGGVTHWQPLPEPPEVK